MQYRENNHLFLRKVILASSFMISSGCSMQQKISTNAPMATDSLNPCLDDNNGDKEKNTLHFTFEDTRPLILFNTAGKGAFHSDSSEIIDRWYGALGRHTALLQDSKNKEAYEQWMSQLNEHKNKSTEEKIRAVNSLINASITYRHDIKTVSKRDYWNAPIETIGRGLGDCEDLAILKYFALRYLDVPAEQMYVSVIGLNKKDFDHAALVIDTQENTDKRYIVLGAHSPARSVSYMSEVKHTEIYYAMNEKSSWTFPKYSEKYMDKNVKRHERPACIKESSPKK